ncbi:MAG: sulfotransferase family 2 domain-containing protein [Rhodothermales bacterium]
MTLIFQHIPKAAGSTLLSILRRHFSPSETCFLTGPGGIREAEFERLPLKEREGFRLVMGHMYFGIHRHLPGPSTYITMLRHPVDRVISHYHYVKRTPHHYLYGRVASEKMSLEGYVSDGIALELNNGQVRSLFGLEHQLVEYGQCSDEMLRVAERHLLENYSVVGLTERFDESLLLMRRRLGWTFRPVYAAKNVARKNAGASNVSRRIVEIIERDNALDLELYERVAKSFSREVEQTDVCSELRSFRLLNGIYGRYVKVRKMTRTVARTSRSAFEIG